MEKVAKVILVILTNTNYPDIVIVVECKKDKKFHQSKNIDNFKNYAVDGVLHYSKYLSKEFDVISIAINGSKENDLSVTNFYKLKKINMRLYLLNY